MTKVKLVLFFLILLVSLSSSVLAQDGPEPPPEFQDDGPEPPPPSAPINQAIPFLALLGVAFVYKTYNKNKI